MSKGLEAFNALGSAFLMKCKDYRNNSCQVLNIDTGEMHSPQELAEIVRNELIDNEKVLEILLNKIIGDKDYFLLVAKNCDLSEDEINLVLERLEK